MDSIVHFEIPADDVKRAAKFYKDAFGWAAQQYAPMEYWMLQTTETDEKTMMPKKPGAINGGMGKREGPLKSVVVTVGVADIDKSLAKVEKLGGKVVGKKTEIPNMGWTAYIKDTEGNVIGLYQGSM
ncbi:MAG: VOC family protein [Thaumarchaeota archaeon]|nr:VOC family protein [Nitrososphaerota archaeon]